MTVANRFDAMEATELRSRRLRAGCSRYQLAHAVGVEPTTVAAWEDGVASIACPNAIEQVLRQLESRRRDDRAEQRGAA